MQGVNLIKPDVTLRLDTQGVIRDAARSPAISDEALDSWVGRPWADTVEAANGDHVRRVIEDAGISGASILLQLTQRFPSGRELLMEYTTVRLDDGSGLLAVGKNLQTVTELQARLIANRREREQTSWKSRDLETRYRLLFEASHEALVLLDAKSFALVDANPAATRALGLGQGDDFLGAMDAKEQQRLRAMFRRVRDYGRSPRIVAKIGPNRAPWGVRASLLAAEPTQILMVQLAPLEESRAAVDHAVGEHRDDYFLEGLMERFPEGFLVLDARGVVERANRAFVDLIQAKNESAAIGRGIGRWLPDQAEDLLARLADSRALKDFPAQLRDENGEQRPVLLSGIASSEGPHPTFGLMLRVNGRTLVCDDDHARLESAFEAVSLTQGGATLPMLVKESSEMLERRYIEAALKVSGGNRTAAAELLGISRQSLHMKLNRFAAQDGSPGTR